MTDLCQLAARQLGLLPQPLLLPAQEQHCVLFPQQPWLSTTTDRCHSKLEGHIADENTAFVPKLLAFNDACAVFPGVNLPWSLHIIDGRESSDHPAQYAMNHGDLHWRRQPTECKSKPWIEP